MTTPVQLQAASVLASVRVWGVEDAAWRQALATGTWSQPRRRNALLQVLATWLDILRRLQPDTRMHRRLWEAIQKLETLLGIDDEQVRKLVDLANLYLDLLQRARDGKSSAPVGTVRAARAAELMLTDALLERATCLPPAERPQVLDYLRGVRRAVEKVEVEHATATLALTSLMKGALIRIALVTLSGASVGALLGSLIPGEDILTEAVKGATPALVAQITIETVQAKQAQVGRREELENEAELLPAQPLVPTFNSVLPGASARRPSPRSGGLTHPNVIGNPPTVSPPAVPGS